jgi:hypothetical protein
MRKALAVAVCFVLVAPVGALADHPDDVFWHPWTVAGPDGPVRAMIIYNGRLIVAGDFTNVGAAAADHVAAWDGVSWASLGTGITTPVQHLTVYDGKLVAASNFDDPVDGASSLIAEWDGVSWTPIIDDVGTLTALQCSGGDLITGWRISGESGGGPWESCWVSSWNGSQWTWWGDFASQDGTVTFPPATIRFLTRYDNQWVAGGSFSDAPGVRVGSLALYDGALWSSVGSWSDGIMWLFASTVHDGKLIVGGAWGNLQAWDGSSWTAILPRLGDFDLVDHLISYRGGLIVGADFYEGFSNGIAAWDGSLWSTMGSGVDGAVRALAVYENKLIVGGEFSTAGGKASPYLAWWSPDVPTAVAITGFDAVVSGAAVSLSWTIAADEALSGLQIVRSVNGGGETAVSGASLLPAAQRSFVDQTVRPGTAYTYSLIVVAADGRKFRSVPASVQTAAPALALEQNVPNPFNPSTQISFTVASPGRVTLSVFTPAGQRVATLVDAVLPTGSMAVSWDGTNDAGGRVSSGLYIYRLEAGNNAISRKMILLK